MNKKREKRRCNKCKIEGKMCKTLRISSTGKGGNNFGGHNHQEIRRGGCPGFCLNTLPLRCSCGVGWASDGLPHGLPHREFRAKGSLPFTRSSNSQSHPQAQRPPETRVSVESVFHNCKKEDSPLGHRPEPRPKEQNTRRPNQCHRVTRVLNWPLPVVAQLAQARTP